MFGSLMLYVNESYGKNHATLHFDTLTDEGEYELFAAFYAQIYDEDDTREAFRYYEYQSLEDPADFAYFVDEAKKAALYDTGVSPVYGDELLTLSTCAYHVEDGRFVVVARRITADTAEEN